MRTPAELEGAYNGLVMARQSKEGQLIFKEIAELEREIIGSSYMAKGEEAIRALGALQGIGLCVNIDEILKVKLAESKKNSAPKIYKP